jgi:hypothetical protein
MFLDADCLPKSEFECLPEAPSEMTLHCSPPPPATPLKVR